MHTILLKFSGPMQSWGSRASFNVRPTDLYPTKSAVLGIVAASLGIRRHEDEKLHALHALDFAVRVDRPGELLRNFHMVFSKGRTERDDRAWVTERYYLEDAVFVVTLSHKDPAFIESIYWGLRDPYFQPFMGRRALPLPLDFLMGMEASDPIELLTETPWQGRVNERERLPATLPVYADLALMPDKKPTLRWDLPLSFSYTDKAFSFRPEVKSQVEVNGEASVAHDHDAFDALE